MAGLGKPEPLNAWGRFSPPHSGQWADAIAFQALLDELQQTQQQVEALKRKALQHDIRHGIEEADRGEFSSLSIDEIKALGRTGLSQNDS